MKLRRIKRSLRTLFFLPIKPFLWAGRSANQLLRFFIRIVYLYGSSRRFRFLLYGTPALIAILLSSYVVASCLVRPAGTTVEQYKSAGRQAVANENYGVAKLYLQRSVELGMQDPGTLFDLAKAAEKTSDFVRLQAIMQQLAPDHQPVHAPSHLWKSAGILSKQEKTQADIKQAILHLEHVLTLSPKNGNAHALLGEIYLQRQLFRDAVPHLEAIVGERPQLSLSLAKAYRYSGELVKATSAGEEAELYFSRKSVESPYNHQARLKWADALLFLKRFQESVQVLNDGVKLEDDDRFRFGLARTYVYWSDSIEMNTPKQRQEKFQLLSAGLRANPNEMLIFDRLMPILAFDDKTSNQAKQFLLDNISSGHAVGLCHLILGSNAFLEKNIEQSAFHLERSIKHMPTAPVVANNLAWYLTFSDNPNLERAMSLIEPILKQYPKVHEYRETRGQIYLRQGNWNKAINDLEFALPKYQKNLQTHDALAVAYEKLGSKELANQHRKIRDWLQEKLLETE